MSIFKRFSAIDPFSNKTPEPPVKVEKSKPLGRKDVETPIEDASSNDIAQSIRNALDMDSVGDLPPPSEPKKDVSNPADKYMGSHLTDTSSDDAAADIEESPSQVLTPDEELEQLRAEMEGRTVSESETSSLTEQISSNFDVSEQKDDFARNEWESTYTDIETFDDSKIEIPTDIFADETQAADSADEENVEDTTNIAATFSSKNKTEDFFDFPTKSHAEGMNLSELRLDIVRIVSDIESGEALYRRAQQRVDSLVGFIEQAEVAVSILKRLEPENRRLRSANRNFETDLDAANYKLARIEGDLTDKTEEAETARVKMETLRSHLNELKADLSERTRDVDELTSANEDLKIKSERIQTNLDIELRETQNLREKHTDLTTRVEMLTSEKINLEKDIETYKLDLSSVRGQSGNLEIENSEIRLNLRNVERQNTEMRDDLIEIQGKIVSYKSQHEVTIHRRDDKISALESRVEELEHTLGHKEEILQSAVLDISELRKINTRHEIERERLEKTINSQNYQITKAEEQVMRSKSEMVEMDQRYKHVAEHLAMQRLRQTAPENANPDIQPEPETSSTLSSRPLSPIERSEAAFLAHYRAKTP